MHVRVALFGPARDAARAESLLLELPEDAVLADLLKSLVSRFGSGFERALFASEGEIWPAVVVTVNGRNVAIAQGGSTRLAEDDSVAIMLVIGGGCGGSAGLTTCSPVVEA